MLISKVLGRFYFKDGIHSAFDNRIIETLRKLNLLQASLSFLCFCGNVARYCISEAIFFAKPETTESL